MKDEEATPHTRRKNNTQFDPATGRLVNSPCPICELADRDPMSHVTKRGNPSCRGHLKSGPACGREPSKGQGVCMMHGGKVPHNMAKGQRRLALAKIKTELDGLGGSLDVDPSMAMLAMVREAAFNVAFLRSRVSELRQGFESHDGAGDGIVGRLDPENWTAAEHVMVQMYDRERDRLVRYAKLCRDAGVEERRVKIEEEQGKWLTKTIDLVIERLGLSAMQREALPQIMHEVIDVLEARDRGLEPQQSPGLPAIPGTPAAPTVIDVGSVPAPQPPPGVVPVTPDIEDDMEDDDGS